MGGGGGVGGIKGGGGGGGGVCIWDKLCEKWIELKEFGWLGWG